METVCGIFMHYLMISILADSRPDVMATHNTQTFKHFLNLHFDWLRAVVFQLNLKIPTCENYKPFAGSSKNK